MSHQKPFPVAQNCVAFGRALGEASLGTENQFAIVARDEYGNICDCEPQMFHVQVKALTPAQDENRFY
jgi:hypothetical protein